MSRHLRDLRLEDTSALQDLLESTPGYTERIAGRPPGPTDARIVLTVRPEGVDPAGKLGIGLVEDGMLVAVADVLLGYPSAGTGYIGLLLVHGDRQGRGLGRELHAALVRRLRDEHAITRLRLGIVATNAAVAGPFWRALGYTPTGEERPYRSERLLSTVALWERPAEI